MATPEPGAVLERVRTFTQDDYDAFAALTGDDNPIHVDAEYAAATTWERTVAHGMFLYSCLCGLLAELCPGAVQEGQDLMFPAPTYTGEPMTLRAEVIVAAGSALTVAVEVRDPEGTVTCRGESRLRVEEG